MALLNTVIGPPRPLTFPFPYDIYAPLASAAILHQAYQGSLPVVPQPVEDDIIILGVSEERPDWISVMDLARYLENRVGLRSHVLGTHFAIPNMKPFEFPWESTMEDPDSKALHIAAAEFVATSKDLGVHWAAWVPSHLIINRPKHPIPPLTRNNVLAKPPVSNEWLAQPESRLLQLPAELRAEIFKHAVSLTLDPGRKSPFPDRPVRGIIVGSQSSRQPALAWVCHQTRAEALPIFYSANVFVFQIESYASLRAAQRWVAHLGNVHVSHLEHLVLLGFKPQRILSTGAPRSRRYQPFRMALNLRSFVLIPDSTEDEFWCSVWSWMGSLLGFRALKPREEGAAMGEWELRRLLGSCAVRCVDMEDPKLYWPICWRD